jgi:hypothetical protein
VPDLLYQERQEAESVENGRAQALGAAASSEASMIYRFTYEGNTPSKKNQKQMAVHPKTKRLLIVPSEAFKKWHGPAVWEMKLQASRMPVRFPLDRCKHIVCKLFFEDRRRRDSSNTFESVMDLLVDAGILADDCWAITGPTFVFPALRPGRPGWELAIETFEPAPGLAQVHQTALSPEAPRA